MQKRIVQLTNSDDKFAIITDTCQYSYTHIRELSILSKLNKMTLKKGNKSRLTITPTVVHYLPTSNSLSSKWNLIIQ